MANSDAYSMIVNAYPASFLKKYEPLSGSFLDCAGHRASLSVQEAHQDFNQEYLEHISSTTRRSYGTVTTLVTFTPMGSILVYHPDQDIRRSEPPIRLILQNAGEQYISRAYNTYHADHNLHRIAPRQLIQLGVLRASDPPCVLRAARPCKGATHPTRCERPALRAASDLPCTLRATRLALCERLARPCTV